MGLKIFTTTDYTADYTSAAVLVEPGRNTSVVFQAKLSAGDTLVLQGRISEAFDFEPILTLEDSGGLQNVYPPRQLRVVATNTSGSAITAGVLE